MGMYPGGFSYGGGMAGYGGYGGGAYGLYGSNPMTGQGIAPQVVQTAPVHSTPLTPYEEVNGELHRDSTSKKGLIIGGATGAAVGAAAGAFLGPVGIIGGAVIGLLGGGLAGDKIGNLVATQSDVAKDGKLDGGGLANEEGGSKGFLGVF